MAGHSGGKALVIILNLLVFASLIAFTCLSAFWIGSPLFKVGVFNQEITATSVVDTYRLTKINPPSWAFVGLWALSYVWIFFSILYTIYTLCNNSYEDEYLYVIPNYMPGWVFGSMILISGFNIGWLIMEDMAVFQISTGATTMFDQVALGLLGGMVLFGIIGTGVAITGTKNHGRELRKIKKNVHNVWAITLLHNGLAMMATWAMIVLCYKLTQHLIFGSMAVEADTACIVGLGVMAGALAIWFCLDVFIFWRHSLYTITPYLVMFVYVIGCVTVNINPAGTIPIFLYVLMSVVGLMLFFKIFMTCFCWVGKGGELKGKKQRWRRPTLRKLRRRRRRAREMVDPIPVPAPMPAPYGDIGPYDMGPAPMDMGPAPYGDTGPYDMGPAPYGDMGPVPMDMGMGHYDLPPDMNAYGNDVEYVPVPDPYPVPVYIDEPVCQSAPMPALPPPPAQLPPPPPPAPQPHPEPIIIQQPAPVVIPAPPPPPIIIIREEAPKPPPAPPPVVHCDCPAPVPAPCPQPVMVPQPMVVPIRIAAPQPQPIIVRQVVQKPQVVMQQKPQLKQVLVKRVQVPTKTLVKVQRIARPAGGGNVVLNGAGNGQRVVLAQSSTNPKTVYTLKK